MSPNNAENPTTTKSKKKTKKTSSSNQSHYASTSGQRPYASSSGAQLLDKFDRTFNDAQRHIDRTSSSSAGNMTPMERFMTESVHQKPYDGIGAYERQVYSTQSGGAGRRSDLWSTIAAQGSQR